MDRAAETLLSDFGRFVGINDLVFDDNGYVNLSFDDVVLNIEHFDDRGELLVYANVGEMPPVADGELFRKLLEANHAAAAAGLGTIGIDGSARQLVYLDRVTLRGLTQQQFQDTLSGAIDRVQFWQKSLKGPFLAGKPANGSESSDRPDHLSGMIRI